MTQFKIGNLVRIKESWPEMGEKQRMAYNHNKTLTIIAPNAGTYGNGYRVSFTLNGAHYDMDIARNVIEGVDMASNYRPYLNKGDKVMLDPQAGWNNKLNLDRIREGTVGTVAGIEGSYHLINWPNDTISRLQRGSLVYVDSPSPVSERDKLLKQVRLNRATIEGQMIEATKRIKADQKIVEEAVPKLEELDGIISDLS